MGIFKDMLSDGQTLFKNEVALDFSFIPKLVPYRESQQKFIAKCMRPLFSGQSAQNVLLHGLPGVGKTVAVKHILQEIEEESEDIIPLYINCWQKNTVYKIALEMCDVLGMNILTNQKTDDIMKHIIQKINRKSLVLVLDEIDKLEDTDFIYTILEEVYRKSIVLITNYKEWIVGLDKRIKSRLIPQIQEFSPYNEVETHGILKQRVGYAFIDGVWSEETLKIISKKTYQLKDIRTGLYLIRQAALIAESKSKKKVEVEDVNKSLESYAGIAVNDSEELDDEVKFILKVAKDNSGKKIGDIYRAYTAEGGNSTYKTFQRKIKRLADGKFISIKKIIGGTAGSTTIVNYLTKTKTLDEF